MVKKINPAQIVMAVLVEATRDHSYEYVKPSSGWFSKTPGGFRYKYTLSGFIMTAEEVIEQEGGNVFVENDKVFIHPRVILHLSNQDRVIKYFETYKKAQDYFDSHPILSKIDWIDS